MDSIANLKQSLSMTLQNDLNKNLLPDESVLISLAGSMGEAFVLTDRRAIIVRERESGINQGCDIFGYALAKISGAEAASTPTGGKLVLKLADPAVKEDVTTVYFPSFEMSKFQSAAGYVAQISAAATPAPSTTPAAAPVAQSAAQTTGVTCPECGVGVTDRMVFCESCGKQLNQLCAHCGNPSSVGAQFCGSCGRQAAEFNPSCKKCGARVNRWTTYCTECGSLQHQMCVGCGTAIQADWKYCLSCGRLIGSDRFDPRAAYNVRNRLQNLQDRDEENSEQEVITPSAQAPAPAPAPKISASTPGAANNERGQQLFEEEDLEGAIREFQMAVAAEPNNASYHYNLAVAYDENERDDEALAEYQATLALDPNDTPTLLALGYMWNENGEQDKAQEIWGKILEVDPDSAEAQEVRDNLRHQNEI